ncbi:hypothetical protein VPH35_123455 [Triticum aestivum]
MLTAGKETMPSEAAAVTAAAAEQASGSFNGDRGRDHGAVLEDRFAGLNLRGEEEEELDLSGEIEDLIAETRWVAIFRVHTRKPFSHVALFKAMRNAWIPEQGVIFKAKKDNLFLAQFMCLGDWNRVMNGGPWIFRNSAVVLEEYDGLTNVEEYKLDRIPVWARIMGLSEGLMKKTEIAEKIAKKVGVPPIKVVVNEGRINPMKYLRARVFVKLETSLVRFVPLTLKELKRYPVEYEKFPDFCDFCGLIGHVVTECGDGIHRPEECEWGEWLLVNFDAPNDRGRGSGREERTAGDGRGFDRRDRNPREQNLNEDKDMEMDSNQGAVIPSARKRLIGQDGKVNSPNVGTSWLPGTPPPPPGFVNDKVQLLEGNGSETIDKSTMSTPQKIHDPKRRRADH